MKDSDDLFLLPLRVPVGSLVRVGYIDVLDTFGETHRVESTAALDQRRLETKPRASVYFELAARADPRRRGPAVGRPPQATRRR